MSERAERPNDDSDDERQDTPRIDDTGRTGDGGPGAHTDDQSGGATNDPASGGIPEEANEDG